jgi:major membrane immunogen (membrane-anchored lipoprotein)
MNKSIVPIIISTLLLLHSCMGFFEENLDNGTYAVQLQSPNDSLVSNSFAITFLWEKM